MYKRQVETVIDPELLHTIGYKERSIDFPYCTSQAQANRMARWHLYTQQYETEIVTYQAGLDHFVTGGGAVMPGQIVLLRDPARTGSLQEQGRVKSATSTQVTLDRDVDLSAGFGHTLEVMDSDGALRSVSVTQSAPNVLDGTFDFDIELSAVWLLFWSDFEAEKVRILSVVWDDKATCTVTAMTHNPSKYDAIELGTPLEDPRASLIQIGAISPVSFGAEFIKAIEKKVQGVPSRFISISWIKPADARIVSFDVYCKFPETEEFEYIGNTSATLMEAKATSNGDYAVGVVSVSATGERSVMQQLGGTISSFSNDDAFVPTDVETLDSVVTRRVPIGQYI